MTLKYFKVSDLLSSVISGEWGIEPLAEDSVNIIRTTNFLNNGQINFNNIVNRFVDKNVVAKKKLLSGDLIIEKSGGSPNQPVGRVVYFENPNDEIYLCNNFTAILRANPEISSKYLFYGLFFNHLTKRTLRYQNKTTGIINLQLTRYLESEKIPLPSSEEQHRIVKILDLAQSLIEKRKQAIAYLNDYIKAVFQDMFGDPVSNPKGWDIKSIKTISHKITDGEHLNPTFSEAGMPMIMAGHVLESGVDTKSARKVPFEIGEFFRRKCNPEKNDLLLVSRGATIGRLCRVTTSELFCLMGSVILIKPDQDIVNSAFLSELLKHPRMYSNLFNSSGSSAQQAIYLKDIKKLDCIIPPINEQRNFEIIVLKVDSINQKMQSQLKELENNFQAELQRGFRQN